MRPLVVLVSLKVEHLSARNLWEAKTSVDAPRPIGGHPGSVCLASNAGPSFSRQANEASTKRPRACGRPRRRGRFVDGPSAWAKTAPNLRAGARDRADQGRCADG